MRKLNIIKPLFENYTAFDEPVVRLASNYKLYLIGGTAIDMLCRYYNIDNNRNRSNNDIDFLSFAINLTQTQEYVDKLVHQYNFKKDIESDYMITMSNNIGIDVDILIDYDQSNLQYGMTVNNVLVMSPSYMAYNKLDRYLSSTDAERKRIDIADVKTLLKIMDKIGETEFSNLESLISKGSNANSMIDIINELVEELS